MAELRAPDKDHVHLSRNIYAILAEISIRKLSNSHFNNSCTKDVVAFCNGRMPPHGITV